jgi:hypothetical protein
VREPQTTEPLELMHPDLVAQLATECAPDYFETADVIDHVRHFSLALTDADLEEIRVGLEPSAA